MKFVDCPYCKKLVNASRYPLHCRGKKHQKLELESEMLIEDQNLCKDDTDPETTSSSESSQSQSLSEKSI